MAAFVTAAQDLCLYCEQPRPRNNSVLRRRSRRMCEALIGRESRRRGPVMKITGLEVVPFETLSIESRSASCLPTTAWCRP